MNDQNRGDRPQIQPPPGWPGTQPGAPQPGVHQPGEQHAAQPPPGYPPPERGHPGYPPQAYPPSAYGGPGQYGQPHQPYGQPFQQSGQPHQPYGLPYGNQPYGTGGYGAPPPPRKRRGLRTVLVLVILAALGGGGYLLHRTGVLDPVLAPLLGGAVAAPTTPATSGMPDASGAPDASGDPGAPEDDTGFDATLPGLSTTVPGCPFTAEQITSMVGQQMIDKGTCLFGDGKGVAQLGVEVHSASSTSATLGYARQQAGRQYLLVEDLKNGDQGYIAYKNTSAEAVAVTAQGGYTITMSGFERFDGFTYEEPLTAIISALPR